MLAKSHNQSLFGFGQNRGSRLFWSHGSILHRSAPSPLDHSLGINAIPDSQSFHALLTIWDCVTNCLSRAGATV